MGMFILLTFVKSQTQKAQAVKLGLLTFEFFHIWYLSQHKQRKKTKQGNQHPCFIKFLSAVKDTFRSIDHVQSKYRA